MKRQEAKWVPGIKNDFSCFDRTGIEGTRDLSRSWPIRRRCEVFGAGPTTAVRRTPAAGVRKRAGEGTAGRVDEAVPRALWRFERRASCVGVRRRRSADIGEPL